jgi:hypothetical protein
MGFDQLENALLCVLVMPSGSHFSRCHTVASGYRSNFSERVGGYWDGQC